MKKISAITFCSLLILVSGGTISDVKIDGKESAATSPAPITTTPKIIPSTTTTEKPTTEATTTIEPEITTLSTTTSSTTTTSTTTPSTTTPSTTTPSTTTPSTTTPFTTTSTTTSTTTVRPPLPVHPTTNKWVLNTTTGMVIVKMAAEITVMYNSTTQEMKNHTMAIPKQNDTEVAPIDFSEYNEIMKISWNSTKDNKNFVLLMFKKDTTNKTYVLSSLEVSIAPEDLPDFKSNSSLEVVHKQPHFNTTFGNSYRCIKWQTFNLTKEDDKNVIGYMKVKDLQFQAFKKDNKNQFFGFAEDCAFDTPDVVPIAVGCVLAGLVVIVLVIYLITRKRSQAAGYVSM